MRPQDVDGARYERNDSHLSNTPMTTMICATSYFPKLIRFNYAATVRA